MTAPTRCPLCGVAAPTGICNTRGCPNYALSIPTPPASDEAQRALQELRALGREYFAAHDALEKPAIRGLSVRELFNRLGRAERAVRDLRAALEETA